MIWNIAGMYIIFGASAGCEVSREGRYCYLGWRGEGDICIWDEIVDCTCRFFEKFSVY